MDSKTLDLAPRCRLSDPAHPHFLSCRYDHTSPQSECFTCGRGDKFNPVGWHYYCDTCKLKFDIKDCYIFLPGTRHPYHLQHPLILTIRLSETETMSFDDNPSDFLLYLSYLHELDGIVFESNNACHWCGKELGKVFYRCRVCGFSLDYSCISQDPPLTIENPKSHQHTLSFYPRPLLVPCSACGLANKEEPSYVCLLCNYLVHRSCIDLPRVIKLTRHPHRLSLTPCLPPPAKRSCGVCYKSVDVKYGLYTCNKGCSYAVHSKCATHKDIWDGKELEGVPEESIEDIAPFVEIGYNLIKHFCHEHPLKFDEVGPDYDANKQCQACTRPIDSDGFYTCVLHCDFFFHASCANLPRRKELPLHKHPLYLKHDGLSRYSDECLACGRRFNGYEYQCFDGSGYLSTNGCKISLDIGCSSICEPFEHKVHPHPLIISIEEHACLCGICGKKHCYTLKCNDCDFYMCFSCATIPVVIRYKHDEHPLILCGGEKASGPYWCEVCEEMIDPKKWFYTCQECCTTLHVSCIFGPFMHLKIGREFNSIEIASNYGNTRPICYRCGNRCPYPGFFKRKGKPICSFECLYEHPGSPFLYTW